MNLRTRKPSMWTLFGSVACGAVIVLLAASVPAAGRRQQSPTLESLRLVSHGLPFRHGPCGRRGIANRNSAAEPTIVSDPRRPDHLLAAWFAAPNYDGLDHAGIIDLVGRSDDGGRGWRSLPVRGASWCAGGHARKDADPALAWAGDGRSYLLSNPGGPVAGVPVTRLALFRFDASGRPLSGPVYLPAPHGYNDRPTITADPKVPSRLYVVWVFHARASSSSEVGGRDMMLLAVSNDRGLHWSRRTIYRAAKGDGLWGTQLFPLARHGLVITYRSIGARGWGVFAVRSKDGGRSWSGPRRIASLTPGLPHASGIHTTNAVNDLSAPGPRGVLYTVWSDNTSDGRGHVLVSRTADGGRSWTPPSTIASLACETMLPAVALSGDTIGVTFYAFRHCRPGTAPLTDVWFAVSHDHGAHWRTVHLAGPFDLRSALNLTFKPRVTGELTGRFLGDYTGLAPTRDGFGAIMILPKPFARYGQQDVFFRQIKTG